MIRQRIERCPDPLKGSDATTTPADHNLVPSGRFELPSPRVKAEHNEPLYDEGIGGRDGNRTHGLSLIRRRLEPTPATRPIGACGWTRTSYDRDMKPANIRFFFTGKSRQGRRDLNSQVRVWNPAVWRAYAPAIAFRFSKSNEKPRTGRGLVATRIHSDPQDTIPQTIRLVVLVITCLKVCCISLTRC